LKTRKERQQFIRSGYERWRAARLRKGVRSSQAKEAEFARQLDIPYSTWSRINSGEMVNSVNVHKLARYYGLEAFDMYGFPRALPNDPRLLYIIDNMKYVDNEDMERLLRFFKDELLKGELAVATA
jgi:hypothetical protein